MLLHPNLAVPNHSHLTIQTPRVSSEGQPHVQRLSYCEPRFRSLIASFGGPDLVEGREWGIETSGRSGFNDHIAYGLPPVMNHRRCSKVVTAID